jgi:hypothetical protein
MAIIVISMKSRPFEKATCVSMEWKFGSVKTPLILETVASAEGSE